MSRLGKYTDKFEFGDLMTVEEFRLSVEDGLFIDYDGFGYAVKDGLEDSSKEIHPSNLNGIPSDATHINWYNK